MKRYNTPIIEKIFAHASTENKAYLQYENVFIDARKYGNTPLQTKFLVCCGGIYMRTSFSCLPQCVTL